MAYCDGSFPVIQDQIPCSEVMAIVCKDHQAKSCLHYMRISRCWQGWQLQAATNCWHTTGMLYKIYPSSTGTTHIWGMRFKNQHSTAWRCILLLQSSSRRLNTRVVNLEKAMASGGAVPPSWVRLRQTHLTAYLHFWVLWQFWKQWLSRLNWHVEQGGRGGSVLSSYCSKQTLDFWPDLCGPRDVRNIEAMAMCRHLQDASGASLDAC